MSLHVVTSVHCDAAACGAWEYVGANGSSSRERKRQGWRTEYDDGQRKDFCPACAPVRAGVDQMKLFESQRVQENP